jgi:hypothetical protein
MIKTRNQNIKIPLRSLRESLAHKYGYKVLKTLTPLLALAAIVLSNLQI